MKIFFFLFLSTIFLPTVGSAKSSARYATTQCLGREEQYLHHNKIKGPSYQLNQILTTELSDLSGVNFREDLLDRWCIPPYDQDIARQMFDALFRESDHGLTVSGVNPAEREQSEKLKKDFIVRLPAFFDQYAMILTQTAPNTKCVDDLLGELNTLQERRRYVGDKVPFFQMAKENQLLEKTLNKLKQIPELWEKCPKDDQGSKSSSHSAPKTP